jgi:hypothetical protein
VAARKPAGSGQAGTAGGGSQEKAMPERPSDDPAVLREAAQETLRKSGEALRKVTLPPGAEPAFVFKP